MLRRLLDGIYGLSAGLAALCLLAILLVMLAQVLMREFGRQFAGADDLTAYLCVGATFFALAATFRRGEMIRVGLLVERLRGRPRQVAEACLLLLAAIVVGQIAWWTAQDVLFSFEVEEVAQGTVPFPLWMPKLVMPLGSGLLLTAIIDELLAVLRGGTPGYVEAARARAAAGEFSSEV
jgi:TRAP-type C4-dicarboxylate transport system permease small subunit